MRKYLFITLLLSGYCFQTFCQQDQEGDILKVDSLKKLLLSFKGPERIDCMVSICLHYYDVRHIEGVKDSFLYYGNKVFNESKAISYKKGIAMGLLILAPFGPDSVREKNIREAVRIGEEINDDTVLGWGYYNLALITDFQQGAGFYKKSIYHFHKAANTLRETEMNIWLSEGYYARGEYEAAYDYAKNGAELLKSASHEFPGSYEDLVYHSAYDMSFLYSSAGDYESAMNYLRMANQYFKAHKSTERSLNGDIAALFCKMGKYDSAMVYWNLSSKETFWFSNLPNAIGFMNVVLGDIYLGDKQYDKAIEVYKNCYKTFDTLRKYNYAGMGIMEASLGLAKAYDEKGNYNTALQYAKEGIVIAQQKVLRPYVMQGYEVLSSVYHHVGNNDSAFEYLVKYNTIKDSIQNRQLLLRIYSYKKDAEGEKKQAQILLLNKDNKLKTAQLKQEAQQKNFLIIGLVGLLFIGFFIFRWLTLKRKNEKLKNEKIQTELRQRTVELEMQALRAQMNPHFIFNCLSSINRFIFKNDNKTASDYLTRFSRLIRMVLMHSQKKLITLEDELEMLRLYLDLERLRFKNAFDYSITMTNIVDAGAIFIPPLLLQPFCENAIWHGLMHKETKGHLNIIISEVISEKDKVLHCSIEDDGIGRKKAAELKSKSAESEKSMGLKITTERLALLNQENNFSTFYRIEDILNEENEIAGTRVQLKIRYKESIEELV